MTVGATTADGRARVLADGNQMPMLGLGVWQVPDGPECVNAVRWTFDLGYRHIDTAQAYGNEESVGRALRDSSVPRDEVLSPPSSTRAAKDLPPKPSKASGGSASTRSTYLGPLAPGRGHLGMAGDGAGSRAWIRP